MKKVVLKKAKAMDEETKKEVKAMNQALNQWANRTFFGAPTKPKKHNKRQWRCQYQSINGVYVCQICGNRREKHDI